LLNLVAAADADRRGDASAQFRARAAAREVEAGSTLLLERAGDAKVGRAPEHFRLAELTDDLDSHCLLCFYKFAIE